MLKKAMLFLLIFVIGTLIIYGGIKVFSLQNHSKSKVALVYWIRIGFLPIPIPIGILNSPRFWEG